MLGRLKGLPPDQVAKIDAEIAAATAKLAWLPNPGPQTLAYFSPADILLYGGQGGGGKALALNTPLPTPDGWTTMGDVRVGDFLFAETGALCRVVAVSAVTFGRP